jgi:hypothetical protein
MQGISVVYTIILKILSVSRFQFLFLLSSSSNVYENDLRFVASIVRQNLNFTDFIQG